MEAKVMTKHEVEAAINPMVGLVKRFFGEKDKVTGRDALLVAAQAEISFKAGYKYALEGAVMNGGYESVKKAGRREVVEFIDSLIIGVDNCKFEERLDGDKGCIVLDMNENQWQAKLKEWGIEV